MSTKIYINGIEASIVRKSINNIYFKICFSNGKIKISAPFRVKINEIKKLMFSKLNWIKKQQEKIKNNSYNFVDYENHYFQGEIYTLRLIYNQSAFVDLNKKEILLYIPENSLIEERRAVINIWYRKKLIELITPLIKKWEHAKYGREKHLANKFVRERINTESVNYKDFYKGLHNEKKEKEK